MISTESWYSEVLDVAPVTVNAQPVMLAGAASVTPACTPSGKDVGTCRGEEDVDQVRTADGHDPATSGAHCTEPGVFDDVAQLT